MAQLPIAQAKRNFTFELQVLETALARIGTTVGAVLADKKIVAGEYWQLLGEFGDVQTVLSNFKPAKQYFLSLSKEDQEKEIEAFAAQMQMPTEDARVKVGAIFTGGGKIYAGLAKAWDGVVFIHNAFKQHTPEAAESADAATTKAAAKAK